MQIYTIRAMASDWPKFLLPLLGIVAAILWLLVLGVRFLIRLLVKLEMHVPVLCVAVLGWLTHIAVSSPSQRRQSGTKSIRWLFSVGIFFFAIWPPDAVSNNSFPMTEAVLPVQLPPSSTPQKIPTAPPLRLLPPSCISLCLQRALHVDSAAFDENIHVSFLHSVATTLIVIARSLPIAAATQAGAFVVLLGPPGSFVRDTWPVLLFATVVALLALFSVASPIVRPIVAVAFVPLVDRIRNHRAMLQRVTTLAAACVLVLLAIGLADHAKCLMRAGYYTPLRAVAPFASPIALCCSLARALSLLPSGGQRRLCTAQLLAENGTFLTASIAAALFTTAYHLYRQADGEENPFLRSADQPPRRKKLETALQILHRLTIQWSSQRTVVKPAFDSRRCASWLAAVATFAMWSAVALCGVATGSEAVMALARLPLRCVRVTAQIGQRAAIACARLIYTWRRSLCGLFGMLLVAISSMMAQRRATVAGPHDAPYQLVQLLARVVGNLPWGPWPLTRTFLAIWRDDCSGTVARGVSHLMFVVLTSAGSVELLCADWQIPFQPLSAPCRAVRRFLGKPPPRPVKFVRDGVAPFMVSLRLLAQHMALSSLATRSCPVGHGGLLGSDACAIWSVVEVVISVGLMTSGCFVMWRLLRDQPAVVSAIARVCVWRTQLWIATSALFHRVARSAQQMVATLRGLLIAAGKKCFCHARARLLMLYFLCAIALRCARVAVSLVWEQTVKPTFKCLMRLVVRVWSKAVVCWAAACKAIGDAWRVSCRCTVGTARFIGERISFLWARHAAPLLFFARQHIVVPAAHLAQKVALAVARRLGVIFKEATLWVLAALYRLFPLVSCASSSTSCFLFANHAYIVAHSLLWSTRHESQSLAATSITLIAGVLGAVASGAVTILLAGEAMGFASLRSLGVLCLKHCDLGAVAASYWILRLLVRVSRGVVECLHLLTSSLSHACRHFSRRIAVIVWFMCSSIWATARAVLIHLFRRFFWLTGSVLQMTLIRPICAVWRSPLAALLASTTLVYAVFCLHCSGAWGDLARVVSNLALSSFAALDVVSNALHAFEILATWIALHKVTLRVRMVAQASFATAGTAIGGALCIGNHAAETLSLDAAFFSMSALHSSPSFAFLVWSTLVATVQLGRDRIVPPKAVAAAQLVLTIVSQAIVAHKMAMVGNPTLPMVTVLLLVGIYLRLAAGAAAERRQAIRNMESSIREAQRLGRGGTSGGANKANGSSFAATALATAPKPQRIYSAEACVICLEPLGSAKANEASGQMDSQATLPCGHQFHKDCVCRWLQTTANGRTSQLQHGHGRCPTCREPIATRRRVVERMLFADG